jgi:dethiobiotin synthetase
MKPVESGCEPLPADALTLSAICSLGAADVAPGDDTSEDAGDIAPLGVGLTPSVRASFDDICPYRLALPVAPQSAAAAEGQTIEVSRISAAFERLRQQAGFVLVETAGGLGSPLAPGLLMLDLARRLRLPVLLVARDALGTVGQTLIALRVMAHEGIRCAGVVLSRSLSSPGGPEAATHLPLLCEHGQGTPVLGVLPFLQEPLPAVALPFSPRPFQAWAERQVMIFEKNLDLSRLLCQLRT